MFLGHFKGSWRIGVIGILLGRRINAVDPITQRAPKNMCVMGWWDVLEMGNYKQWRLALLILMLVCHAICDILLRVLLTFGMCRLGRFTSFHSVLGRFVDSSSRQGGKDIICAAGINSTMIPKHVLMTIMGCHRPKAGWGGGGGAQGTVGPFWSTPQPQLWNSGLGREMKMLC